MKGRRRGEEDEKVEMMEQFGSESGRSLMKMIENIFLLFWLISQFTI